MFFAECFNTIWNAKIVAKKNKRVLVLAFNTITLEYYNV